MSEARVVTPPISHQRGIQGRRYVKKACTERLVDVSSGRSESIGYGFLVEEDALKEEVPEKKTLEEVTKKEISL